MPLAGIGGGVGMPVFGIVGGVGVVGGVGIVGG
jgi:hypothetical protein